MPDGNTANHRMHCRTKRWKKVNGEACIPPMTFLAARLTVRTMLAATTAVVPLSLELLSLNMSGEGCGRWLVADGLGKDEKPGEPRSQPTSPDPTADCQLSFDRS